MNKRQGVLIKGLAISLIVLYHFQAAWTENAILPPSTGLFDWLDRLGKLPLSQPRYLISLLLWPGFFGVNIFFVLSGYGLTQKYEHLKAGLSQIYLGMVRQIEKIYKPYLLAHPIVHLGVGAVWWFIWRRSLGLLTWLSFYPWQSYLKSLLIIPRWFNNDAMFAFVGTWWFVGVIIQLYLIFPLLYYLKQKLGGGWFLALVVVTTFIYRGWLSWLGYTAPVGVIGSATIWWINFPSRLAEFGLGMVLTKEHFEVFKDSLLLGLIALFAGLVSTLIPAFWFINDFLLALAGIWLMYYLIVRLPDHIERAVFWLGRYSYYIYLLHEPFLGMLIRGY